MNEEFLSQQEEGYKAIFIGDTGTGKTSIINRFIYRNFDKLTPPTVGLNNLNANIKINDKNVNIKLWDTAGQEQYSSLVPMFCRDTDVCVVVSDVTRQETIKDIDKWIELLHSSGENPPIIIAANKVDLPVDKSLDLIEEELVAKYKNVVLVSALTGKFIKELFDFIARTALEFGSQKNKESKPKKQGSNKAKNCC